MFDFLPRCTSLVFEGEIEEWVLYDVLDSVSCEDNRIGCAVSGLRDGMGSGTVWR